MKSNLGILAAFSAALFNGSVGILSKGIFASGMSPGHIAFYKCLLAFLILSAVALTKYGPRDIFAYLRNHVASLALCAACGFFVLYFFETTAYLFTNVATVVFILFGASTITTFLLNAIMRRERPRTDSLICLGLALAGLLLIFRRETIIDSGWGIAAAAIAGIGYGAFLVLSKRTKIGSGILPMWGLTLFASVYLAIPVLSSTGNAIPPVDHLMPLLALAILPTIGGFWCTTYALTILSSEKVQIIELTEPLFATFFSMILLSEMVTFDVVLGGGLILASIILMDHSQKLVSVIHKSLMSWLKSRGRKTP